SSGRKIMKKQIIIGSFLTLNLAFASGSTVSKKEYWCENFNALPQMKVKVNLFKELDDKWDGKILVYKNGANLAQMTTSMEACKEAKDVKNSKNLPTKSEFVLI